LFSRFLLSVVMVFFFWSSFVVAQTPFYRKISFLEGLPTQVIYDSYVAKNGMLYLGTDKGLIAFDGIRFKEFPFNENLGLAVNSIQEDNNGVIWCKNFANQVFFLKDNILQLHQSAHKILSQDLNNLVDFLVVDDKLWLLTEKKLLLVRKDKNPKIIHQFKAYNQENAFTAITYDSRIKKIYIASIEHFFVLHSNGILEQFPTQSGQKELTIYNGEVYYNIKGRKNEIWDKNGNRIETILPDKNTYFINTSVANNDFWLCTSDGLYELNVTQRKTGDGFLRGKKITDVVSDKERNIWVSTLDEGLYFIPNKNFLKLDVALQTSKTQLNFNSVATSENGQLFVGTSNGKIIEFNTKQEQVFVYDSKTDMEVEYIYLYENKIISSIGIFNLGQSNPVIGGYFGKIITEDASDNFVIASYNLAGLLPKQLKGEPSVSNHFKAKEIINFNNGDFSIYPFRFKRARSVFYCDKKDLYYVGYSDGLYVYDNKQQIIEIKTKEGKPIVASRIISDGKGAIWVASTQQGILKIQNNKVVQAIAKENGLSSNHCKRIQLDSNGLWAVTDNGLDFIDFKSMKTRNVGLNLGLKGININDFSITNDQVFLATNEGVLYSDKQIFQDEVVPKFSLSKIKSKKQWFEDGAVFDFQKNAIDFHFQTIHYKSLGNYSYEYRLKEFDTNWTSQSAAATKVSYLALKPGNYTFEARVRTSDVVTPIQSRNFVIKKPFWMTYWFGTLMVLLFFGIVFVVFKWATNRARKKQLIKEQLALSQLTALRTQMNPHFMFNVLNAVQGLIYSNQKSRANEYLGTFSDLMRKTLDVSDKRSISIYEELETIKLYVELEKARFEGDDFDFILDFPKQVDLHQYQIPSLIVQPFVENAIKHGLMHKTGKKILSLSIKKGNENYWKFEIKDNGIGREQSGKINASMKKHQSFATKATSNRITLINKLSLLPITLQINDLENEGIVSGTQVVLQIPIKEVTL
jgi:ligand-binding sensor domain-containing protein